MRELEGLAIEEHAEAGPGGGGGGGGGGGAGTREKGGPGGGEKRGGAGGGGGGVKPSKKRKWPCHVSCECRAFLALFTHNCLGARP